MSPTMSPGQQKLMQYLPVMFAAFQIFFLLGLVLYYIVQACLRILQQAYITHRFYGHDESLGRQAQRASEHARELSKSDGGGGLFSQAKRDLAGARGGDPKTDGKDDGKSGGKTTGKATGKSGAAGSQGPAPSKRTTPPKNRPTPSSRGPSGRPASRPGGKRSKKR